MVTIIFESHATSLDNEAGLSSGLYDVELSELGKKQAKELGQRYKDKQVKSVRGNYIEKPFPNGESYQQCANKMKDFLQNLLKDCDNKKVMIIGHRATQYGLEHLINKVPLKKVVTDVWQWQSGWTYHLKNI